MLKANGKISGTVVLGNSYGGGGGDDSSNKEQEIAG
jgi:hypothetical protein